MRHFTKWILTSALWAGLLIKAFAQPTVQAHDIIFSSAGTNGITLTWSNGDGTKRIVILNSSAITFTPTDNNTYAGALNFGTGTDLGSGQKCVFNGGGNTAIISGLSPNTQYFARIYEYTGAASAEKYLTTTATNNPNSAYTLASEPTTDEAGLTFTTITTNAMTVNMTTPGNGAARMLVAFTGGAVGFAPVDGTSYSANGGNYSTATNQSGNGKIVGIGAGPFSVTNLSANTSYNFKVFEFNGTAGTGAENYFTSGTPGSGTQSTAPNAPSTQGGVTSYTALGSNGYTINVGGGNGANRMIVINTSAITFTPSQGVTYSVNNDFTAGTDLGSGQKCIFNGSGTAAPVVGLSPNTQYFVTVYEYNGGAGLQSYNVTANTSNRFTLANQPTADEAGLTFTSITPTAMTVNMTTPGDGTARMLVAFTGGAVGFAPVDGTSYSANGGNYSTATNQAGNGKIVGIGAGPFSVTNLSANTSYNFKVFEFNGTAGTGAENYFTSGTPGSGTQSTAPNAPSTQGSVTSYTALGSNGYTINVGGGNGANRMIVINTSAITFTPSQGVTYSVNNDFTAGTDLGSGQKCIFNGSGTAAPVVGLSPNTQYFVTVYEYNGGAGLQSYNVTANTSNRFTLANQPTADEAGLTFTSITPTAMTVNMTTPGDGTARMLVAFTGGAVGFAPVDGTSYSANGGNYSTATNQAGNGKIVGIGAGPFSVTNLSANTSYNFKVFEFNGTAGTGAENYFTSGTPGSGTQSTAPNAPSTQANIGTFTAIGTNGFTINWSGGNGANRIVIVDDAPITFNPQQGITYSSAPDYSTGVDLGSGQKCVYNSSGTSVAITGLNPLTQYYIQVFEYNGAAGLQSYNVSTNGNNPKSTTTLCQPPVTQASGITFGTTFAGTMVVNWTPGSGPGSILFIRQGSAVGAAGVPVSGTAYSDGGNVFGAGTTFAESGQDDYVVYVGTGNSVTVSGLDPTTQYFFSVYSYNTAGTCFLTTAPATGNNTTSGANATSTLSVGGSPTTSFQSTVITEPAAVIAFTFTASDLGDDGTSTRFSQLVFRPGTGNQVTNWDQVIAGAELHDNLGNGPSLHGTAIIGPSTITIPSISNTNLPDLGAIKNNATNGTVVTRIYTLYIWLNNPILGGQAATIDNKHIALSITGADAMPVPTKGSFLPTTNTESGSTNDKIIVGATKITVLQQPGLTAFQGAPLSPEPKFEAVDIYGNRDTDFAEAITVVTSPNLGPAGAPATFGSGVADFTVTSFKFNTIGTSTMKLTTPSITAPNSSPTGSITVSGNNESTIVENTGFSYPTGIDYTLYQKSGTLVGLPSGCIKVGEFFIQDGGADLTDADGVPTTLTNLTLNVTNPGNIRLIGIYDGASIVASVAGGGPTATFSGLSIAASDGILNNPKAFAIYVSFNAPVTDDDHFEFQIASVTASATGSVFANTDGTATGTGGAKTSTVTTDNQVFVTATKLHFFQQPTNTLIDVAMAPVSVEAIDGLNSRDIDLTGTVTVTSNGLPTAQGTAVLSSGLGPVLPAIVHTDRALTRQLTATLGGVTNALSNTFDITTSAQADITPDGTFTAPTDILYANYQAATIPSTGVGAIPIARFIIRDKGASPTELDGAPTLLKDITFTITNGASLRRLALFDDLGNQLAELPATAVTTFLNLNAGVGYGPADNGTKFFTVYASFNNTPATVVDNTQFQLAITSATTTTKSSDFAASDAGNAKSVITGNSNKIEVVATHLEFFTEPAASLLPNKDISLQPPVPVVKAFDGLLSNSPNNIVDLDYSSTTIAVSNPGPVPMSNVPGASSLTSGVLTFASNFRYTDVGNGTLTVATTTLNQSGGSVASAVSTPVSVAAATATKIVAGSPAPGTISSISNTSPGTAVFQFIVSDDLGAAPAVNDGSPTLIKTITITQLANNPILGTWTDAIQGAQLDDGNTHITPGVVAANSITFSNMITIPTALSTDAGYVQDDQPKTYTLSIWLKTGMTAPLPTTVDGANFGFEVKQVNISTSSSGTGIIGGEHQDSGGAAFDKVAVVATELDYTSIPSIGSIGVNFAPVVVEARDINHNRDLNFTEAVAGFNNDGGATMINTPFTPDAILSFNTPSAGVLTLPSGFQFTSTPAPNSHLNIKTASISTFQQSSPFTVVASQESVLAYVSGGFVSRQPYINFQSGSLTVGTSAVLAKFRLNDGIDGVTDDSDGSGTNLSSIQVEISTTDYLGATVLGSKDIRNIALFDQAGVKYSEVALGAATTATFNTSITAGDHSFTTFTIQASFLNSGANIQDLDNIQIRVIKVTQGAGSEFNPVASVTNGNWTKATGAVTGAILTPTTANIIDVVSTQLVFVQQPPSTAGTQQPVPIPPAANVQVNAYDANNILDLELNSSSGPVTNSNSVVKFTTPGSSLQITQFPFDKGIANVPSASLTYTSSGNGTLTATANNLPPTIITAPTGTSSHVDVFDVTAAYSFANVTTTANLASGSTGRIIYGVTFSIPYKVTGLPKLNGFTISFTNDIIATSGGTQAVIKNPIVYEQIDQIPYFSVASKNIVTTPSIHGAINVGANFITIDFTGGTPRVFDNPAGGTFTYTYYLQVDIENTANSLTKPIQPYVVDNGWVTSPSPGFDPTYTNIVVAPLNGALQSGAHATKALTQGQNYTFAAIFPPKLISSNPATAATNADPNGDIVLNFDVPVWSLDHKISLYQTTSPGAPGTFVADMNIVGTQGLFTTADYTTVPPVNVSTKLTFAVPAANKPLAFNTLYYITIAPGVFNSPTATDNTGIMDAAGNRFSGISSPGTVYFRTASNIAPSLFTTPTVPNQTQLINVSLSGATIQATFDEPGTAYWMLTGSASPPPSRAQILGVGNSTGTGPGAINGVAFGPAIARNSFQISQTKPIAQYGIINATLTNGTQYKVWMFAANDDLPTAYSTSGPFDASLAVVPDNSGTATFTFTAAPPTSPAIFISDPSISVCPGSYQPINVPITLVEKNNSDLAGTGAGLQYFNLLLPTGFTFDTSAPGLVTLSPTADFVPNSGAIQYLSSSVVQIQYQNATAGNTSIDNLTISGLSVISSISTSGNITKLGGSISNSVIPDGKIFGAISTNTVLPIGFQNSYNSTVTFLPDQFTTTIAGVKHTHYAVQLVPDFSGTSGDYGQSIFTGSGVTLDSLHLNAVTLGQPFNITISHTDNNGCVSQNVVQYLVYDHNTGLGIKTQYCINTTYFPLPPLAATPPASTLDGDKVLFDKFPGFYLESLGTGVPVGTVAGSQYLDQTWGDVNGGSSPLHPVNYLTAKDLTTPHDPGNSPHLGVPYYDYTFDANDISTGTSWTSYSTYTRSTSSGNKYYTGGNLGTVEFKGFYQSIANLVQPQVPLIQNADFFAPALAYIEVSGNLNNGGKFDATGSGNMASADGVTSGYPGTYIFCENNGPINFNGWPAASATSSGVFALWDFSNPTAPVSIPATAPAFKDNGNGTATIDPSVTLIKNNYKEILVTYIYQDGGSPCKSVAKVIIRITPNPVASFTIQSLGPNADIPSATCVNNKIDFTSTSVATLAGVGNTITSYQWDFGDASQTNPVASASTTASATYAVAASYNSSLTVTSNWGCSSVAAVTPIRIGNIPIAKFDFTGASDLVAFTGGSSVASVGLPTDNIVTNNWDFDFGTLPNVTGSGAATSHAYTNKPGPHTVQLTSISSLGCKSVKPRNVVTVPQVIATAASSYLQDFESDSGQWVHYGSKNSKVASAYASNGLPSWRWGVPIYTAKPVMKVLLDSALVPASDKLWVTNLSGSYNQDEHSALYSPVFDISQLERPMLSFNMFSSLGIDGVVLQYSIDNLNIGDSLKVWTDLGDIATGVDWYNSASIGTSPGDQPINPKGWTGRATSTGRNWLESKHSLDALLKPSQVVFRFALASGQFATVSDGFAIDNFRLGNRTRTLMLENFKNLGDGADATDELAQSTFIKNFNTTDIGTQLVKLNYDVAFPGIDPLNQDNSADPSARALYYNIKQTPVARLDGNKNSGSGEALFENWGPGYYNLRSLQLAEADIFIENVAQDNSKSILSFDVRVVPVVTLGANTVLQVAIAQQSIALTDLTPAQQSMIKTGETSFEFVMKKMLPSAAGTQFGQAYSATTLPPVQHFDFTIDPGTFYGAATKNISIIAFLQDADTKEIWQSEILSDLDQPGSIVTGLTLDGEQVKIYPNPSNQQFTIELPRAIQEQGTVKLMDQLGKIVHESPMQQGTTSKIVNTGDLAEGLYIIQLDNGSSQLVRAKIIVRHGQ